MQFFDPASLLARSLFISPFMIFWNTKMWWESAKSVGKIYLLLWMVAVGGIVGANLAGVLAMIFAPENKSVYIQPWVHRGWVIGTGIAFFGAITGRLRMISGGSTEKKITVELQQTTEESQPEDTRSDPQKLSSIPSAVLGIGFFGGLLGTLFGASLLVFWFSLNYSPFAIAEWADSIHVRNDSMSPGKIETPTKMSDHPIAIYLVVAPAILGSFIGAVAGGVGSALGKVHDG